MQIINWGVFAIAGTCAVTWLAVIAMMIPYPKRVAEAGGDFTEVFTVTGVFCGLAVISGVALWLLMRRHALLWYGQTVLGLVLAGALGWALQSI